MRAPETLFSVTLSMRYRKLHALSDSPPSAARCALVITLFAFIAGHWNLATDHLVGLEFAVLHLLQNVASQSTFSEAFPYHTGVDTGMNVDGIRSSGVQVVSEGRYDEPGEQFPEHPTVRNFEVSAGCN